MATTEVPTFTFEFEEVSPIVLLAPSDDLTKSYAAPRDEPPESESDFESEPELEPEPESEPEDMNFGPRKKGMPETGAHKHPIPLMQDAFNESLLEATQGANKPKLREYDVKARRERLIGQGKTDDVLGMRWRYRPGQEQHELCKLMAQISFGMYLLLRGLANSDDQVVTIIQGHIDEIDEFLEVALEDFQQASADLSERIKHLRLPLEHIEVFEKILEDRSYRAELLRNNEIIEHILARTSIMLGQYEKDMTEGLRSTKAFANYLGDEQENDELAKRPEVADIYDAMKGNTNGWHNAFIELDEQAQKLNSLIGELTEMVGEMQMKAGEVSRRTWVSKARFLCLRSPATRRRGNLLTASQNMIEPFSIPGVNRSHQGSPSSEMVSAASNKSPESNSVRESISTAKAPSHHGLTIRTQLSPAPEDPFDDKNATRRDGDSGNGSQTDSYEGDDAGTEDPLYILQPRTYTPKLPAPLPSPMVKEYTPFSPQPESPAAQPPPNPTIPKRSSLRQRTSAQGRLPESIQIPPPSILEQPRPRTSSPKVQCPPDSAYGSDGDQRNRPGSATSPSFSRGAMPSPRSDFQAYHPVQASPYSPLQQRPHTSHNTVRSGTPTSVSSPPRHVRNQPSRLGGASTLSKVTTLTYGSETGSGAEVGEAGKMLKKKKSKFGWLRKAFTLDEDERNTFEARREAEARNLYYEQRSRTFLDGRRVRESTRGPGQQCRA